MPKEASIRQHRGEVTRLGTTYPRNRTATACQVCRVRRTKCDNERPCSSCRRLGAVCASDTSTTTSGFDPASLRILEEVESLRRDIQLLAPRVPSTPDSITSGGTATNPPPEPIAQHLQRGNLGQVLRSWPICGRHVPPHRLPYEGDAEAIQSSIGHHAQAARITDLSHAGTLAGYLNDFFAHVHIKNPVLDEPDVRAQFSVLMLNGMEWNADACLLLFILANGARALPFPLPDRDGGSNLEDVSQRESAAQALFDAAEKRKGYITSAPYHTQARCCFFAGVFLMAMRRPFAAWQQFLQGVAMCQGWDTRSSHHRAAAATSPVSSEQAQESVYWSCWKSERELRFELDLADFKSPHCDFPAMFPSLPPGCAPHGSRAWYFYLAEISLWRIETVARQALRDFVERRPSATLDELAVEVVALEQPLLAWHASLPESIRLADSALGSEGAVGTDVLAFVLQGRLTYNYEVLTWPFLEMVILSHVDTMTEAISKMVTRAIQVHYDRLYNNRPGFYYRHHGTWLMEQSTARSAFVLLAVARSSSVHLLPRGWKDLIAATIDMLEYWDTDRAQADFISFLRNVFADCTHEALGINNSVHA